jgi:hypothetical protein
VPAIRAPLQLTPKDADAGHKHATGPAKAGPGWPGMTRG